MGTDMPTLFVPGFVAGVLFAGGVGGHFLRLVMIREYPSDDDKGRKFVAWSAVALYTCATLLVLLGIWTQTTRILQSGYFVAIVGPMIGLSAVVLLRKKVDLFQKMLGLFQIAALVLAGFGLYWSFR